MIRFLIWIMKELYYYLPPQFPRVSPCPGWCGQPWPGRGEAEANHRLGSRRSGVQESAESSLQSASATSPHHTAAMEPDKLGFRIVPQID